MFRPLRYLSVASLIAVALAAVILGALYRQIATSHLSDLGESNNVALAQIFANSIWPPYRAFAEKAKTLNTEALRGHPDIGKLHQSVLGVMGNTPVVKVKLYQRNGRTLFSTDAAQIGKDYSTNPGFISAIQGKPVSEITHRDKFSAFDEERENRDVLSSYIPLRRSSDAPIEGVLEIYSDVTELLRNIDRQERLVILAVIAVLGVLYGVLFLIARRADRLIKSQFAQPTR
jgi:hypothetical protein